jgi:hypothetical protein
MFQVMMADENEPQDSSIDQMDDDIFDGMFYVYYHL